VKKASLVVLLALCVLIVANTAVGWNGKGHQVVAYIAYEHLDPPTRAKVDVLLTPTAKGGNICRGGKYAVRHDVICGSSCDAIGLAFPA